MYAQLGAFIFKNNFTPETFSHTDETTYAEHALIGLKPRLQPTANNLEEIALTLRLRAESIDVAATYKAIKKSKDTFEVLPFLMGDGTYRGDYVITKIEDQPVFQLDDGFTVEMVLNITLREYQVADKLEQEQSAARKNAFAVGKVTAVRQTPKDFPTPPHVSIQNLSAVHSNAAVIDQQVRNYQNNVSQQVTLATKIENGIKKINGYLDAAQAKLDTITDQFDITAIAGNISNVKDMATHFSFPPASPGQLADANRDLQGALNQLKTASIPLVNLVVSRTI